MRQFYGKGVEYIKKSSLITLEGKAFMHTFSPLLSLLPISGILLTGYCVFYEHFYCSYRIYHKHIIAAVASFIAEHGMAPFMNEVLPFGKEEKAIHIILPPFSATPFQF